MLAIINNVAAYLEDLSATASLRLLQLFASMSSPSFLLANETNHTLLTALLESMNAIIEHQFRCECSIVQRVSLQLNFQSECNFRTRRAAIKKKI